jgi:hypothetical protein
MPGSQDVRAVLDPLVQEFGLDDDIYSTFLHHAQHSMSRWKTYEVKHLETNNLLLLCWLKCMLKTCRQWNLAYGRKDVLEALAKACRLGMKADPERAD